MADKTLPTPELPRLLVGGRRKHFVRLCANGAAQGVVAAAVVGLTKIVFDGLYGDGVGGEGDLLLLLGLLVCAAGLLRWRAQLDGAALGQSYVHALRKQLYKHVLRLGADAQSNVSAGGAMLRFVGDLGAIRQWVSNGLAKLAVNTLMIGVAFTLLFWVEATVAVVLLLVVVATSVAVIALGPLLRRASRQARRRRGELAGVVNDRLVNLAVVDAFGGAPNERDKVRRLSNRLRNAMYHQAYVVGALRALVESATGLASIGVIATAGFLVSSAQTTPGGIVAAVTLVGFLTPRLTELGRVYEYWIHAQIAKGRQLQILGFQPRSRPLRSKRTGLDARHALDVTTARLDIENVQLVGRLDPTSIQLVAGDRLLVVGPNGSGKSTLLKLIAGVLSPGDGKIQYAGFDLNGIKWRDRTQLVATVSADLPLLRDTLRNNITYGCKSWTEEDLEQVVQACEVNTIIDKLPAGLETKLRNTDASLSTGERMRVMLARALIRRPKVLLLDEADANLDDVCTELLWGLCNDFDGIVVAATHSVATGFAATRTLALQPHTPLIPARTLQLVGKT